MIADGSSQRRSPAGDACRNGAGAARRSPWGVSTTVLVLLLPLLPLLPAFGCSRQDEHAIHHRPQVELPPARLLEQGREAYARGDWAAARTLLDRVPMRVPERGAALNLLGLLAARQDSLQQALSVFKSALDRTPELAFIHNNLGAIYALEHRPRLAAVAFAEAARLDSAYPEPLRGELLLRLQEGKLAGAAETAAALRALEGRLPAGVRARKHQASLQSLPGWPWPDVERLLREALARQAQEEAAPDSLPPGGRRE